MDRITRSEMSPAIRSVVAVLGGLASFFAAGGAALASLLFGLMYLLTKPNNGIGVAIFSLAWGFLAGIVVGFFVSGWVTACIVRRARFVHSALVFVLAVATAQLYIYASHDSTLGNLRLAVLFVMIFAGIPFLALGAWLGSRKLKRYAKSDRRTLRK